jgi:hypothetical protein
MAHDSWAGAFECVRVYALLLNACVKPRQNFFSRPYPFRSRNQGWQQQQRSSPAGPSAMHFLSLRWRQNFHKKGFNYYRISVVNFNSIEGGKQTQTEIRPEECSFTFEQKSALVSFPGLSA